MRPLTRRWTPEDDELLKDLAARGASLVRAAAALKRKKPTVRERARKLGCPFPPLYVVRNKMFAQLSRRESHSPWLPCQLAHFLANWFITSIAAAGRHKGRPKGEV
jgi:hypothetical protein